MVNFCKDCKHILNVGRSTEAKPFEFARCGLMSDELDPVSGMLILKHADLTYCSIIRKSSIPVACGPHGQYFEPRSAEVSA
jgi:hypothetical protein